MSYQPVWCKELSQVFSVLDFTLVVHKESTPGTGACGVLSHINFELGHETGFGPASAATMRAEG